MPTSAFWIQIPYSYSGKNIIGWFKEARGGGRSVRDGI